MTKSMEAKVLGATSAAALLPRCSVKHKRCVEGGAFEENESNESNESNE